MMVAEVFTLALLAAAGSPHTLTVDPEVGNNTMTAVFDAPAGERISAISSSVSCALTVEADGVTVNGSCSVPLSTIMVDNEPTKTEHFQQWSTNKKGEISKCAYEAKLTGLKLQSPLKAGAPAKFAGEVPFTVCGRGAEGGAKEQVTGTATVLEGGTVKLRAKVEKFNRERYHVGPKWTDGWLARVQSLANVVAPEGTVDLTLFAKSKEAK